jgi:hypothetical protein
VYPTRKLAAAALQTLCEVVNAWAYKESRHDPPDRVDAVMRIFALAAFAQYHFVEIHSFFDGNGRLLGTLRSVGAAYYYALRTSIDVSSCSGIMSLPLLLVTRLLTDSRIALTTFQSCPGTCASTSWSRACLSRSQCMPI